MITRFALPALLADIGGTNARFALAEDGADGFRDLGRTPTAAHPDPHAAVRDFALPRCPVRPRTAILAVAAPVTGDRIVFTNCPWVLEPRRLVAELGFETVVAVNDFEAQALALPGLGPADLVALDGGLARPDATRVVIGPGTGLGVAQLIASDGRWIPVPGEGGHASLAPDGAREEAIWHEIAKVEGRVCAEAVLSGPGLVRLHDALRAVDGLPARALDPAGVTAAAEAGDAVAREAVAVFVAALGRFAGDVALIALARGGVYLAGGIPPRLVGPLAAGGFRAAFENKPPYRALMAEIATAVVIHPLPAFVGLAAWARHPDRFAVDVARRRWSAD